MVETPYSTTRPLTYPRPFMEGTMDNIMVRELPCQRAFVVASDIGLWVVFERKMEIAEGSTQNRADGLILGRAGTFSGLCSRLTLTSPPPLPFDRAGVLIMKSHQFTQGGDI
ncbi:hypothetical protein F4809DRAFT_12722 [Biscogniauxia mediterranea]|nr:hypothetical protein F4809DRAFT_12722 [Biscogniauxia mediterranea]